MKKVKIALLALCFAVGSIAFADAQTSFDVPEDAQLTTQEDYAKYEQDVINAAQWLENTDLNKEAKKRKAVNTFVIRWVSGSPTVSVDINSGLMDLYGKNTELMGVYLASYSSYCLQNKQAANLKKEAAKAGILSMIKVYNKGIDIKKNKEMDKAAKLAAENKLDEYVANW